MFGRKKGIGSAGHIKKNTRGTSNEISFSVLDAMKNSADGETDDEGTPLGRISLFTLGKRKDPPSTPTKGAQITMPSAAGQGKKRASGASPRGGSSGLGGASFSQGSITAEASVRKKERKRSKRAAIALGSLVAVCVLVVVGVLLVNGVQSQMSQADRMRMAVDEARLQIDALGDLKGLLETAETAPLEQLANDGFAERAATAIDRIPGEMTKLRAAKTSIEDLQPGLISPLETDNANQALSDINEYLSMLEQGKDVLTQVSTVVVSYQKAIGYQTLLLEADALAREAIEVSNASTEDAFNQAMQRSREAFEKFAQARDVANGLAGETKTLFDAAPVNSLGAAQLMQPYADYANLRVQAQEFAIAADEAFLSKSSAKLIEANNSYNELETQAAELIAQQGGVFPAELIAQAFEQVRPRP